MGYNHASAFAEPPPLTLEQTRECVEYLMIRAAERFLAEFPDAHGHDINTEIDADARTVKAWASGHWRIYAFDALI